MLCVFVCEGKNLSLRSVMSIKHTSLFLFSHLVELLLNMFMILTDKDPCDSWNSLASYGGSHYSDE